MTLKTLAKLVVLMAVAAAVVVTDGHTKLADIVLHRKPKEAPAEVAPPAITVVRVSSADFIETVLVTGSLVAREEILVAPEIEGLKVVSINVDQGDKVKKGDILATLVTDSLDSQMAQNTSSLARSTAAIAQAKSQIAEAEARMSEAKNSLARAKPLSKSGYLSESVLDQRESASKTTAAQVAAAKDGLKAAEADKASIEAQRKELIWRRGNTDVKAPADGIVSRRGARIGAIASAAGTGESMFRIISNGEIELDAEVTEAQVNKLGIGQTVAIAVAGGLDVTGKVRLISPEIDSATRLGRVRIFIGENPDLRIGAFASGVIETARQRGLSVPVSAISYNGTGVLAQAVVSDKVETRTIKTGLTSGGLVQVTEGLNDGDVVVARAGTFLRDGDVIRPIAPETGKVSEVK